MQWVGGQGVGVELGGPRSETLACHSLTSFVGGEGPTCVPSIGYEGKYLKKFNANIYHNLKITMLESEFSMQSWVDPGNLTKPTIGGVCVKGAMT